MEFAINSNISNMQSELDTLEIFARLGGKNVFLWWGNNKKESVAKAKLCKKLGLNVVFAHLDFQNTNSLWTEGEEGDEFVRNYEKQFKLLKKHKIKIGIMHVTKTTPIPPASEIGIKRFQQLANLAEKYGVFLALENSRLADRLAYVWDNVKSSNLKICYDSGHDHIFTHDTFDFEKYGGNIVAVHLHDNDGNSDQHALPFDGNIDWEKCLGKLKKAGYCGPITLEVKLNEKLYGKIAQDIFIKEAMERAEKLAEIFEKA